MSKGKYFRSNTCLITCDSEESDETWLAGLAQRRMYQSSKKPKFTRTTRSYDLERDYNNELKGTDSSSSYDDDESQFKFIQRGSK